VRVLVFCLAFFSSAAFADIVVENPWSRATPPGSPIGVGYMTIRNTSATPDKLLSARSPAARAVQTHVTVREGDITRMREVNGYDIPANGELDLKPSGPHLMLVDLKAPLKEGEKVPLVLRFQHAGEVKVELHVESISAAPPGMQGMHH
jgi:copper(I)-binding protein